jgi:hypothetical protein
MPRESPLTAHDAVANGADGDDDGGMLVELCRSCGAPNHQSYIARVPGGVRSTLPLGPNGGVIIRRRLPGAEEWLDIEYFPPDAEHDQYIPVDPLLDAEVTAITLGLTLKTLYARAPFMASSEKHGNRWFFQRDVLLTVDAASEQPMPTRRDILAERTIRRQRGSIRRAGSHKASCDRCHTGSCGKVSRAPRSQQAAVTRAILDDLGK